MRYPGIIFAAILILLPGFVADAAEEGPRVELFSPQGVVKKVRQVSARFSGQMVSFGDPRAADPFEIACPETGRARWADSRTWIYDFDRDLPAGVVCEFTLRAEAHAASGRPLSGSRSFSFSTGGPAVLRSWPPQGATNADEAQVFVLELDAEAEEGSVLSGAFFEIEGINERVGVNIVGGAQRAEIMQQYKFLEKSPVVLLQCRQKFPAKAAVSLIWGKGITARSGVSTADDQVLKFKVRDLFRVEFSCDRENARANCVPVLPMTLNFTSPVSWEQAKKIALRDGKKTYHPGKTSSSDTEEGATGDGLGEDDNYVSSVVFRGPFPESSELHLELPKDFRDDAGRQPANRNSFPLVVRTDAFPPLAKFSARFGIIESKGEPVLPVTVRNIEPGIKTRMLRIEKPAAGLAEKAKEGMLDKAARAGESLTALLPDSLKGKNQEMVEGLKGRLHKIRMGSEEQVIAWLGKVAAAKREKPFLPAGRDVKEFQLPKPGGDKAFEVIGIPLKDPGFYVVEMESRILGKALLGNQGPMFVPAATLVTNLSAHFKWGRESSLVWVTSLDRGEPVKEASVSVRDCSGKLLWEGKTDGDGIAKIRKHLPSEDEAARCSLAVNYAEASHALSGINRGLFVFARTSADMTFVHSGWEEGIEPWRFQMPYASDQASLKAHAVLDRSLLRAGETVHMKHILRKGTSAGFAFPPGGDLPSVALLQHIGSDQRYEVPLKWDKRGGAETVWKIPQDARLGQYVITLVRKSGGRRKGEQEYTGWLESGSFRVEEFRVPLMKGSIQPVLPRLVNVSSADLDLSLAYLSGGGAKNAKVKLKNQVQPKVVTFTGYEEFVFANGEVRTGKISRARGENNEEIVPEQRPVMAVNELTLDSSGSLRTTVAGLPQVSRPHDILAELEFRDPNGEVQTIAQRIPLWPADHVVGIRPESWAASKEDLRFHVLVLDLSGRPVSGKEVKVDIYRRQAHSHRKRLVGGFYSYEHSTETKKIGRLCEGRTDRRGLLICEVTSPASGNVILQAEAADSAGNRSVANRDVWIAGKGEWWFDVSDHDRIDLIPEQKRYEPGALAKFQVRMPFREATALVSVEREGIVDTFVKKLSGKSPVIEVPVKGGYAPNIFVSALVVRGRVSGVQPTAMVDLGRPAFKLGLAEIQVGWKAFALKVNVQPDREVFSVREKANVKITVRRSDGRMPPRGSEVAVAAVDEGLLELMPNRSWKLLEGMMGRRGYELRTATAQMQVVGRRHFGLKALPQGGGGGRQSTRELFDTLLFWKAGVQLNERGEAAVEIPLNDSLTGFRIVAVATGGKDLFGTGESVIRTSQELMVMSGLPPLVREGDSFEAGFTVRNTSGRGMDIDVSGTVQGIEKQNLQPRSLSLQAGSSQEVAWDLKIPQGIDAVSYEISATEKGGTARDSLKAKQKVAEAVPERILQATLARVEDAYALEVERPHDAVAGKGGVSVNLRPKISGELEGLRWYMKQYPYTCMEQKISKAVSLRDNAEWKKVMAELPAHLDSDGLVKYFPVMSSGSDVLTSYIYSIASEAGWSIPDDVRGRMEEGLRGFVDGRVARHSSVPAADLPVRKLAALEALSRSGMANVTMLGSISAEPNLWPTSAVIDWLNLHLRMKDVRDREKRIREAEQILRARLNVQGTTLGFSTERTDHLWWLMVSADLNAVKIILPLMQLEGWAGEIPLLVRGALGRQHRGAWDLTTANAWGVLALEKFSQKFEAVPVAGETSALLDGKSKRGDWQREPSGFDLRFPWPKGKERLSVEHSGSGKPWVMVQSRAAIPLREPLSSGYTIIKSIHPVERRTEGSWSKGDVVRVRLEMEAQSDMSWVVVSDPIPAGAVILGTGLGRDSQIMTSGGKSAGHVWPAFEERSFGGFRAYYEFVPKGRWVAEYTVRLNNSGTFRLPQTRAEAMYAPEMFGEIPNKVFEVGR